MKRLAAILTLLACLSISGVAYAVFLESPSSITIDDVRVYRNLAETGDSLYVFQHEEAFTSDNYPVTPASDSFLFRLYGADNITKATVSPYVYPYFETNGYGSGVSSFYFGASDNAPVWGSAVRIEVVPSPAFFDSVDSVSYVITPTDYTSSTSQEANRSELENFVFLLCDRLEAIYTDTSVVLKTTSDSGIVLSAYGELYFRGAIEGIQALCPDLFFIQVYIPERMSVVEYDMSLMDTYTDRLDDTDLGEGFENIGDMIGVSGSLTAALIFFGISLALCIWTSKKGYSVELGILGSAILGIMAAIIIGDIIFVLLMCAALLAVIGIMYMVVLKRA